MGGGSLGKIAGIALPLLGTVAFPGVGTAIGTALGATSAAGALAAGGAVLGGAGGLISGGGVKGTLTGAALGGAGGYLAAPGNAVTEGISNGLNSAGFGNAAYDVAQASDAGAGTFGALESGAGVGAGTAGGGALSKLTSIAPLLSSGVQYMSGQKAISAEKSAEASQAARLAPYNAAGTSALKDYNNLLDPNNQKTFIQSNPLYNSLADDAARRLNATAAAEGKLGTGGTANALQTQLLNLGNGLVQQRLGNDASLITGGQSAAAGVGAGALTTGGRIADQLTGQGNAAAGGIVGATNTNNAQYQNNISTLLALQNLKASNVQQYQVPALNL